MLNRSILTAITFLPAAGAVVVALLPRRGRSIQWFALLVSLATFILSLHLPAHYSYSRGGFQFQENRPWIASPRIHYRLGVDGLSMWLVVLTAFLAPVAVLASWSAIRERAKEFYCYFLLQQTAMIGVFVALDLFLYYAFWELSLIPMAILIAAFGRGRGPQAALKFFVYAFVPSALLLVGILWLYSKTATFDFFQLRAALLHDSYLFPPETLFWVSLAFLAAFAVKVPVFPLHGWLSDAFSEAPTAMGMVIAGKLGLYSLIRFHLELFPAQARQAAPWMIALAVAGILYGALLALTQKDLKRMLAYSTLGHLSFCILGIYALALTSLDGAIYQILNHGVSAGALFLLLGFLYERYGTYEIAAFGGLAKRLPDMATLFTITSLSLIGLPLLNGFVGEFLILSGSFPGNAGWVTAATLGVILSAAYMLWVVQRVFFGGESPLVSGSPARRLGLREHLALWPLALLMLAMGVASPIWMRAIDGAAVRLAQPAPPAAAAVPAQTAESPQTAESQ